MERQLLGQVAVPHTIACENKRKNEVPMGHCRLEYGLVSTDISSYHTKSIW